MSIPSKAGNEAKREEDDEQYTIPPFWTVGILAHHLEMDVGVLVASKLGAGPDFFAVVQSSVDKESGDGSE